MLLQVERQHCSVLATQPVSTVTSIALQLIIAIFVCSCVAVSLGHSESVNACKFSRSLPNDKASSCALVMHGLSLAVVCNASALYRSSSWTHLAWMIAQAPLFAVSASRDKTIKLWNAQALITSSEPFQLRIARESIYATLIVSKFQRSALLILRLRRAER